MNTEANFFQSIGDIVSKYPTDNLCLIGKGPSVDRVRSLSGFRGGIINVNDSELVFPGDFSVFHHDWVFKGLAASGYRCRLYLTSLPDMPLPPDRYHQFDYVPFTEEKAELILGRLLEPVMRIEAITFVTAIRLAVMIGKLRGRAPILYFLGFDFSIDGGVNSAKAPDLSRDSLEIKRRTFRLQEKIFLQAKQLFEFQGGLKLRHVGEKAYSFCTPEEFDSSLMSRAL